MIAALFLLGPVVVVPLGLRLVPEPGGQTARAALDAARLASLPAGLMLVVAYLLPSGVLAAALAVPWFAVALLAAGAALAGALGALHGGRAWRPGVRHGTGFALGALSVAAGNAVADRLGVRPIDFAPLRRSLSGQGRSIDVVDPALALDHPLRRACRRSPPPGSPVHPVMLDGAVEPRSVDVVFLLMAAHEAHGPARSALLRSAARAIGPGGRLILVEHLRDAANIVAFGPGAWHFSRREAWIETTTEAGLRVVDETKLSPFVRGFVLASATDR